MVGAILVVVEVCGEEIGEEEKFHHHKEYEKLNQDYEPQRFAYGHLAEAGVIEHPDFPESAVC